MFGLGIGRPDSDEQHGTLMPKTRPGSGLSEADGRRRGLLSSASRRKAKDFKRADAIRDELKSKGWIIEDTPRGARLKRL